MNIFLSDISALSILLERCQQFHLDQNIPLRYAGVFDQTGILTVYDIGKTLQGHHDADFVFKFGNDTLDVIGHGSFIHSVFNQFVQDKLI